MRGIDSHGADVYGADIDILAAVWMYGVGSSRLRHLGSSLPYFNNYCRDTPTPVRRSQVEP
jgi:hypothetical protein